MVTFYPLMEPIGGFSGCKDHCFIQQPQLNHTKSVYYNFSTLMAVSGMRFADEDEPKADFLNTVDQAERFSRPT
jgi:hypothetical protein